MAQDRRMLRRIAGLLNARLPDAHLDEVADPRQPRGKRWQRLAVLLKTALVGLLAGCRSTAQTEALTAEMSLPMRRLLRIEPLEHQTPHEYAGLVAANVPAGRSAMERIADYYVAERFGGKEVVDDEPDQAWEQAWPTLWRRWVEWRTEKPRAMW